jgi:hypothetical protein
MITPKIKQALESNGVRFYAKDFLMEGLRKDCVDAVYDARLVYELLKERMELILNEESKDPTYLKS